MLIAAGDPGRKSLRVREGVPLFSRNCRLTQIVMNADAGTPADDTESWLLHRWHDGDDRLPVLGDDELLACNVHFLHQPETFILELRH